jgi:hypothetical protein
MKSKALFTLALSLAALVAACGIGVEDLAKFEADCKPALSQLTEFPDEKFSIARFCWCSVKDKKSVADCQKIAEE